MNEDKLKNQVDQAKTKARESDPLLKSNDTKPDEAWREKVKWRNENIDWLNKSVQISLNLLEYMDDEFYSVKELSVQSKINRDRIKEILSGKANLTIKEIQQLSKVVGYDLISVNVK